MSFHGGIFDVDGVLVESPHERAWRETLKRLFEGEWRDLLPQTSYGPPGLTTTVYREHVSGKPRLSGATAALVHFGVPDAERRAREYAERKQAYLIELIEQGQFTPFDDALRFILEVKRMGLRVGAASSSKNAGLFMKQIRLDTFSRAQGRSYPFVREGLTLQALFDADVCGIDLAHGKPHPEIFERAADALGLSHEVCFVVEDAVSGIQAAKAGHMAALGIARLDDAAMLAAAGADLVVTSLDDVSLSGIRNGSLERNA